MDIQKMCVLLVEGNHENAGRMRQAFAASVEAEGLWVARSLQEAHRYLARRVPDVVIAGWLLPDGRGTELVPAAEEHAAYPVLVLLNPDQAEAADIAIQAGAWDYALISETTLADLPHAAARTLHTWRGAVQCRQLEQMLRRREEQLQQAQTQEAVAAFARITAHDFNNRLSFILGYTQMALHELPPGSSAQSYLQEVQNASRQSKERIQQFLTFGRSSEQRHVPIRIEPVMTDVLQTLQASWPVAVDTQLDIAENAGLVLANRLQLGQALLHLCAQVGSSTRDIGERIDIRIDTVEADATLLRQRPELRSGPYLRLHISRAPHAVGNEHEYRPPQSLSTGRRTHSRTHLELTIVRAVIASHGGVFTGPNASHSAFVVYLPQITDMPSPIALHEG